jgi:hypothetical protein
VLKTIKSKTLYHGTTYENFKSILKNGFKPREDSAWICSDTSYMFFYDADRKSKDECFRACISNIIYTAIFNDFQGSEFVIIEIEVPEDICILDDPTIDKNWNDNYQKSTAVKADKLQLGMIKNVYINHNAYNKYLRWWYFANKHENGNSRFVDNDLFKAVLTMTESMDYKKKCEYLDNTTYNIEKYVQLDISYFK